MKEICSMSVKNQDDRNRFRSKTVGFRVSSEEWMQFEIAVKISGLNKQDYLINRLHDRSIIVQESRVAEKFVGNI